MATALWLALYRSPVGSLRVVWLICSFTQKAADIGHELNRVYIPELLRGPYRRNPASGWGLNEPLSRIMWLSAGSTCRNPARCRLNPEGIQECKYGMISGASKQSCRFHRHWWRHISNKYSGTAKRSPATVNAVPLHSIMLCWVCCWVNNLLRPPIESKKVGFNPYKHYSKECMVKCKPSSPSFIFSYCLRSTFVSSDANICDSMGAARNIQEAVFRILHIR